MLIKCPECGKEISDKSKTCIHCGFPLEEFNNFKPEEKPTEEFEDVVFEGKKFLKSKGSVVDNYFCPKCHKQVNQKNGVCSCGFKFEKVEKEIEYKEMLVDGKKFHYINDSSKPLCPHCNKPIDRLASLCSWCGKSIMMTAKDNPILYSDEQEKLAAFESYKEGQQKQFQNYNQEREENDGRAIGALVLGICGLVFSFWLSGPGLICAIIGACLGSPYTKGFGYGGKIMSWISIIASIVGLIVTCGIVGTAVGVGKANGLF